MVKKKNCNCLNCGTALEKKEQLINYCQDCFMGLDFSIKLDDKDEIFNEVEKIMQYFVHDVSTAFQKDPAANSLIEVLSTYPGIQAVLLYRVAHFLWTIGLPYVPRFISYIARQYTGIDIHPGAKIGDYFFIDHGQGVVIGETAEIGNNVTIYQGVSLGGTSLETKKRHPTLGNNIVVGAGAKLLGPIKIGDNVKIGANSVVTKDIPDNSVCVGVPGRVVIGDPALISDLKRLFHGNLPDPVIKIVNVLESKIAALENKVNDLENTQKK